MHFPYKSLGLPISTDVNKILKYVHYKITFILNVLSEAVDGFVQFCWFLR